MSDLLDKYRASRRANDGRISPPSRSALYPRLSSLDREGYTSDRYTDVSSSTAGLRDKLASERTRYQPSVVSKYDLYSDAVKDRGVSFSDGVKLDSSFATRLGRNDLDDKRTKTKPHGRNYELDGLRKNLEAKYGLASNEATERSSRILGSPLKPLNAAQRRSRNEISRRFADSSPYTRDKYKVTKPATETPHSNGFLSRIVHYFTSNEHNDYDGAKDSSNSDYLDNHRGKRVSFSDDIGRDDFDEVDEVVTRAREKERLLALENFRSLEREHKKVLSLLEDIQLENKKLKSELSRVHDTFTAKLDEIENDLFNKTVEADQLRVNSERKHTEEITQLKAAHEAEVLRLRKSNEKELTQLKSIHEEEVRQLKDENSTLHKRIRELDERLFDTGFELKQAGQELDLQVRKNREIQVEMSLRDRFRAAKLPAEEVNDYFIKSSRIEQKIEKLRKQVESPSPKPQQFLKTDTNIEENLRALEKMTKSFQFSGLGDCERYYEVAHKFLTDASNKSEDTIQQLELDNESNPSRILSEYLTLKKLNELSYRLCSVKELINDCIVLSEFKDSDANINDIYLRVKSEIF
ncbi:hypothetical protein CANMA_000085 [Candida margitis]|uniref:uncharacterized protein n=1 Tax=Candida margitis TaxID=1775924 RepID=UPI00222670A7|nr:uncharacterized protein CANMA_000085 [Candida margitis]KAI5970925.1 hypothetical protein CANMA_000085 [Candida margitis]